jgi:hypothetical protein
LELFAEQRKNTEPEYKNLNITILVSIFIIGVVLKMVLFQKGITLSFYVRDFVENGNEFVSRLHNFDKYISIILLGLFGIIIINYKKLNWSKLLKLIFIGAILGSIAYIIFAYSDSIAKEKVSYVFTLNVYTLLLVSETIIYSIIFYIIYRTSPNKFKGLFQGISTMLAYVSNTLLFIGPFLYEKSSPSITFIVFSLILLVGAILVIVLMKIVKQKEKELEEIEI